MLPEKILAIITLLVLIIFENMFVVMIISSIRTGCIAVTGLTYGVHVPGTIYVYRDEQPCCFLFFLGLDCCFLIFISWLIFHIYSTNIM